jgi:hypothetical protein
MFLNRLLHSPAIQALLHSSFASMPSPQLELCWTAMLAQMSTTTTATSSSSSGSSRNSSGKEDGGGTVAAQMVCLRAVLVPLCAAYYFAGAPTTTADADAGVLLASDANTTQRPVGDIPLASLVQMTEKVSERVSERMRVYIYYIDAVYIYVYIITLVGY